MSPAVSIIVPVYNAEKYLHKCVDSVLAQGFTDFELLLVDDGSTDRSGAICDGYAASDSRVRVFHKANGGVSSARNTGLDNARGEYIMFVDSGDRLEAEALEFCSGYMGEYDVVRFSAEEWYDEAGRKFHSHIYSESCGRADMLRGIISHGRLLAVWGGVYSAKLFRDNNIRFDTAITFGEDWLVLFRLIKDCASVKTTSRVFYYYSRYNESSCVNTLSMQKYATLLDAARQILGDPCAKEYVVECATCKCKVAWILIGPDRYNSRWLRECCSMLRQSGIYPSSEEIRSASVKFKRKLWLYAISRMYNC